MILKKKAGKV